MQMRLYILWTQIYKQKVLQNRVRSFSGVLKREGKMFKRRCITLRDVYTHTRSTYAVTHMHTYTQLHKSTHLVTHSHSFTHLDSLTHTDNLHSNTHKTCVHAHLHNDDHRMLCVRVCVYLCLCVHEYLPVHRYSSTRTPTLMHTCMHMYWIYNACIHIYMHISFVWLPPSCSVSFSFLFFFF